MSFFSQTNKESEKKEIRKNYMFHLHEQGYRPEIDDDGDVKFKYEGKTYFLLVKTPTVFTVARYLEAKDACKENVYEILSKTTREFWNVTLTPLKGCDAILFSSRSFLSKPEDFKDIFEISINSVKNAVSTAGEYYND
ncbi:MAG: hypothetical protein P8L23_00710 [Flavobacteriales bacterium]|nr:hypothetical protein [Flavobacteriales bacterium]